MFLDSIFLFFFGIGINSCFQGIFYSLSNLNSKYYSKSVISIKPIIYFVGILFFCSLINSLLLIPSILNLVIKNDQFIILVTKDIIFLCKLIFIIISLLGLSKLIKTIGTYLKNKEIKVNNDICYVFCLLASFLMYFVASPKSFDIHYDTGAYHLPYVLHLSSFAIEKGLTFLNFGYGFYHLNFFGQVPIQNLSNLNNYISPSLNILFFSSYLWFFISEYKTSKEIVLRKDFTNIKNHLPYLVIIYFGISLVFYPENIFNSLSSYSAALPQFICGSIALYTVLFFYKFSNKKYSFISVSFLALYSPIIKGTGLLLSSYLTIILLFFMIISYKNKYKYLNFGAFKTFLKDIFDKYLRNEKTIFFIIFSYLIALLTNVMANGYPLYPYTFFGPIGNHALPLKEPSFTQYHINWARFAFNGHDVPIEYSLLDWLPNYLISKDGITTMLFWIIPTTLAIFIQFIKKRNLQKIKVKNYFPEIYTSYLFKFSLSFLFLQLIIILFLIPVSVYLPWIVNVSIFILFLSINDLLNTINIKIKKSFKILICIFVATIPLLITLFSIKNKLIIANLPRNFFGQPFLPDIKNKKIIVNPKNWEPSFRLENNKVRVTYPTDGDQCWTTPPPCLRYISTKDEL